MKLRSEVLLHDILSLNFLNNRSISPLASIQDSLQSIKNTGSPFLTPAKSSTIIPNPPTLVSTGIPAACCASILMSPRSTASNT